MLEIIHWQRNLFQLPFGKANKDFIREETHLSSYMKGNHGAYHPKGHDDNASTVAACRSLVPRPRPMTTQYALKGGLVWEGKIPNLHLIQTTRHHNQQEGQARAFACLMFEGKVRAALHMLSQDHALRLHQGAQPCNWPHDWRPTSSWLSLKTFTCPTSKA